jgi:hypothetical protein
MRKSMRYIRLLNRVIVILCLILLSVVAFRMVWNLGHYSGKVAGEAGVLLFQIELRNSLDQGYTFRWDKYRFTPTKTSNSGFKNVLVSKITTSATKEEISNGEHRDKRP